VGAEFAVPGVALGAGVRGVWLAPPFVVVWVWVGCWRLSFVHAVSRVLYLECLPMLLSAPALCHCDRGFCDSPYAVPLLSHAVRAPYARRAHTLCVLRRSVRAALFVASLTSVTSVARLPPLSRNHFFLLMYGVSVIASVQYEKWWSNVKREVGSYCMVATTWRDVCPRM
jgi:hypothetical protein